MTPEGQNLASQLPPYYQAKGDADLVVVSQIHRVPLPITQAPWNCGADHRVGLACWEGAFGGLATAAKLPFPQVMQAQLLPG